MSGGSTEASSLEVDNGYTTMGKDKVDKELLERLCEDAYRQLYRIFRAQMGHQQHEPKTPIVEPT